MEIKKTLIYKIWWLLTKTISLFFLTASFNRKYGRKSATSVNIKRIQQQKKLNFTNCMNNSTSFWAADSQLLEEQSNENGRWRNVELLWMSVDAIQSLFSNGGVCFPLFLTATAQTGRCRESLRTESITQLVNPLTAGTSNGASDWQAN